MSSIWIAALFALFIWWFSTGAILLVVRRADRAGGNAHRHAAWGGLPLLGLGIAGAVQSLTDTGVAGAYLGFLSALAIWGWIELAFLTGTITGPDRAPCPPGLAPADRLWRAWNAIAHHELLLCAGLLALLVLSDGQPNMIALWTYAILFVARISAKLNLFFGVPQINVEFVPRPLEHLKSHFRRGPVTLAFPLGITVLSFGLACCLRQIWGAATPAEAVGAALLAALAALALLEHWLMVVALPDAKLWRWMLPAPAATPEGGYPPVLMTPSKR